VARLSIEPVESAVEMSDIVTVSVRIDGASELWSAAFSVEYDPELLEVVDADAGMEGVQVAVGPFLGQHRANRNFVGVDRGVIEVEHSSRSGPVDGSGVLAQIALRGRAAGTARLEIVDVLLQDDGFQDLPSVAAGGSVEVRESARSEVTPSPTISPTVASTAQVEPGTATPLASAPSATAPPSPLPTPPGGGLEGRAVLLRPFAGTWVSWDVTALLRSWLSGGQDNQGLAIASAPRPDADPNVAGDLLLARWASAGDAETAPHIVIEYRVLPVTPTPTPAVLLPPAGRADTARLGALVALAVAGLMLVVLGVRAAREPARSSGEGEPGS
jgi:hypothetical protein